LSVKAYPCCKATHSSIEAVLQLMEANGLTEADVEEVEIGVSPECYNTVGRPFRIRKDPQVDAQFSIAYTVAAAIQKRRVGLAEFREEEIREPSRGKLAGRIRVAVDPELKDQSSNVVNLGARVRMKARGRQFSSQCDTARGNPRKPLGRPEVLQKFLGCLEYSGLPLPEGGRRAAETILNLENEPDVGRLSQLLCGL
jgi:2-methylcitrate dehydratase PrpD